MGVDVFWWFCKVEDSEFSIVQSEFDQAMCGVPDLPEVPTFEPRPKNPPIPVTKDYAASVLGGMLMGGDLSSSFYHEPFDQIGYRILKGEFPLTSESIVDVVIQSRVAPPAILLMGIGRERFAQLPGCLGNMLVHSSEIEQTLESVSNLLNVEWDTYFERAKLVLDYAGFDDHATKDVSAVLHAIPKALEKVRDEKASLLSVTSWGCP
ncbi:hypothetical protein [Acaryochloris marina]|uniref:hypothetical protein n=1 Tax=Acaryochloris marina TaxID=155978 RepID=UPI0021C2DDDB|nr:hypothetical protein [Acaryochloris marina]BDM83897.1 hypothetical protein AM10699_67580 [Acaryochloris marina MBIC10699]